MVEKATTPRKIVVPRIAEERAEGFLSPSIPHTINHLVVGDLGDDEILAFVTDSGNVGAFYTDELVASMEESIMWRENGSHVDCFFVQHVGSSAWGLAIHKRARMIAVSANTHFITVFAFALTTPEAPALQESDGFASTKDSFGWIHLTNINHWRKLSVMSIPQRRAHNLYLQFSGHTDNIPCVNFLNSDLDPHGDYMVSVNLGNELLVWRIWQSPEPVRCIKFAPMDTSTGDWSRNPYNYGMDDFDDPGCKPRGWHVLAVDPRCLRTKSCLNVACPGGRKRFTYAELGDRPIDKSRYKEGRAAVDFLLKRRKPTEDPRAPENGESLFSRPFNFSSTPRTASPVQHSPSPGIPYRLQSHTDPAAQVSEEPEDDSGNLLDASDAPEATEEQEEGTDEPERVLEDTEEATEEATDEVEEFSLDERTRLLIAISARIQARLHSGTFERSPAGSESDSSDDSEDDQGIRLGTSLRTSPVVDDALLENCYLGHYRPPFMTRQQHRRDNGIMVHWELMHNCKDWLNFPIVHFTGCDVRMMASPLAVQPSTYYHYPLEEAANYRSRLSSIERFNLVLQIPELGVIVAALQKGRVGIFTLTDVPHEGPTLRLDHIFPSDDERPPVSLYGIAAAPIDEQRFPCTPASATAVRSKNLDEGAPDEETASRWLGKQFTRRYKLILHYIDHTILHYELFLDWPSEMSGPQHEETPNSNQWLVVDDAEPTLLAGN
ncbi:hypothetical protein KEM55_001813 [Ascosphaera atra]|nr:hypothetical protein KEM55_001813 [Ascosphaera atra]